MSTQQKRYIEPILIPTKVGRLPIDYQTHTTRLERAILFLSNGCNSIYRIAEMLHREYDMVAFILAKFQFLGLVVVRPPMVLDEGAIPAVEHLLGSRVVDVKTIIATDYRLCAIQ